MLGLNCFVRLTRGPWMLVMIAFCAVPAARGQVVPSAYRNVQSLWVGGEYSNVHASFPYGSNQRLWGAGVFFDYNLNGHVGAEADARFLHFNRWFGESESSYLAGPRYLLPRFHKFQPYAKCLFGVGKIHYPFDIGDGSYFAIAPGGGLNYRMSHRITLRGEYEYQLWPGSPGFSHEPKHELTPNGFHIGVAYRLFR